MSLLFWLSIVMLPKRSNTDCPNNRGAFWFLITDASMSYDNPQKSLYRRSFYQIC